MTGRRPRNPPLTSAILDAIIAALDAALAGDGFEGGDFDGQDRAQFEIALGWAHNRKRDMERMKRAKP